MRIGRTRDGGLVVIVGESAIDVTEALGIPARTLRDWRARGRIGASGSRVDAGAAFRLRHAVGVG